MKTLNVYGLPQIFLRELSLSETNIYNGDTVIVIDVLRATTTILHALDVGAKTVVPVLDVDETIALKETIIQGKDARFPHLCENDLLLGGERLGKQIAGFDLGNSPSEYTPEKVTGKTILFSTTNGTKALHAAAQAVSFGQFTDSHILPASFLNAAEVVNFVLRQETSKKNVHIVCAGTDGGLTEEDLYLAGLLVERIQRHTRNTCQLNVQAVSAWERWVRLFSKKIVSQETLAPFLHASRGGKNLHSIKLQKDIDFAAKIDSTAIIALLDPEKKTIEPIRP